MTPASEFLAWRFLSCNNVKSNPRMTKSVHCGIPYVVNKNKITQRVCNAKIKQT